VVKVLREAHTPACLLDHILTSMSCALVYCIHNAIHDTCEKTADVNGFQQPTMLLRGTSAKFLDNYCPMSYTSKSAAKNFFLLTILNGDNALLTGL
jgi:hypothetical protein